MKKNGNSLIVIENGALTTYILDDKNEWTVGRPSKDNMPDISMRLLTVSREHGVFHNMNGIWCYIDKKGKNGTVYNGQHVKPNKFGKIKPISLANGDVLIFGGCEEAVINKKTAWSVYLEKELDEDWRVEDTKGWSTLKFSDENESLTLADANKGTVVEQGEGIAIYMGDITYLYGKMNVSGS